MRHRLLIYVVIGLGFGLLDWYFLAGLASIGQNTSFNDSIINASGLNRTLVVLMLVACNYGIWLVPVIPAAMFEMKLSRSVCRAAVSASVLWSCAMLSYYTWYAILLILVGLPNLEFMLLSNRQSPTYWSDWWPPFQRIILNQFGGWIGIAVVGGAIAGALSALFYAWFARRRKISVPAT